jgi:hypothetical protein
LLALYPLTFVSEGDQVIIGRPEIDSFAVFSADAAALIRRLEAGESLGAAASWYQAAYGEPADLADFVSVLDELEFLRPAGPPPAGPLTTPASPLTGPAGSLTPSAGLPVRWQRLGRVAFAPAALAGYAALIGYAIYLIVTVPALRPRPSAVFFSFSVLAVLGVTLCSQGLGVAWHEWFHVLAGRRIGLRSKLSIGRRLYFVVVQTTLAGLMGVPARKRILPLAAGLLADALYASVLIGVAEAGRRAGWPPWLGRMTVGLAYLTLLRMLWQAMFFMETDLCHVLASALRCPDLHKLTRDYLRNRYLRRRGRAGAAADESGWSARDAKIARRYAPFVLGGSVVLIASSVVTSVPVFAGLAVRLYRGVGSGALGSARFWDSAVSGALIAAQLLVVLALKLAERRTKTRQSTNPGSTR